MSVAASQTEAVILQMLVPNLEAEGFQVFLRPSRSILPSFMQGYLPDAVAVKADKKIAIEIKSDVGRAKPHIQVLRDMFSRHQDWELRVIYASDQNAEQSIAILPRDLIAGTLDRIMTIYDEAGAIPALLTGWSVFEAAARSLIPGDLGRPQPANRLLEILASDGYITPEEADALRILAHSWNTAAHGHLDVSITRDQVASLVSVTRTLLQFPKLEG